MQRAMARQAEAERERRAKIINSEGEYQAAQKLTDAADIISTNPATLQLRYLQTLLEMGVNQNTTIVFPLPIDLIKAFQGATARAMRPAAAAAAPASASEPAKPQLDDLERAATVPVLVLEAATSRGPAGAGPGGGGGCAGAARPRLLGRAGESTEAELGRPRRAPPRTSSRSMRRGDLVGDLPAALSRGRRARSSACGRGARCAARGSAAGCSGQRRTRRARMAPRRMIAQRPAQPGVLLRGLRLPDRGGAVPRAGHASRADVEAAGLRVTA